MAKFSDDAYERAYENIKNKNKKTSNESSTGKDKNENKSNASKEIDFRQKSIFGIVDFGIDIDKYLEEDDEGNAWYVIHTEAGRENILIDRMKQIFTEDEMKECFLVKRERRRRLRGKWTVVVENIFKGYIFVVAKKPEKVFFKLKEIPMFSKILTIGEYNFIPLSRKEIEFISKFGANRRDHTAKISTIDLNEGDEIEYIGGDLAMFAGQIKKIDKHKRRAVIEVEMFGRKTEIYMDVDFLQKKEV